MKRKKVIIRILAIIIMIILIKLYQYMVIDTEYAVKYAKVFGSFDINEVDQYVNDETMITYKSMTKSYKDVQNNIIKAFKEKKYQMSEGDSYGHAYEDLNFLKKTQNVGIYVSVISDDYSSHYVEMEIECRWFFFYKIKSIKSEDRFFGYLFFGEK